MSTWTWIKIMATFLQRVEATKGCQPIAVPVRTKRAIDDRPYRWVQICMVGAPIERPPGFAYIRTNRTADRDTTKNPQSNVT